MSTKTSHLRIKAAVSIDPCATVISLSRHCRAFPPLIEYDRLAIHANVWNGNQFSYWFLIDMDNVGTDHLTRPDLLLPKAIETISNIAVLYQGADNENKRAIVGSMYPE